MPPKNCTVLIVNDSWRDRTTYRGYLQQETRFAYTVWEAESTEAALRLCSSQTPDSIVLNYLLPDRDGLEFLSSLKTSIGENCPPVIMLNEQGNEAIAIQAFKAGVEDYLIKDEITSESLRYVTRTAIENFRLRQELRQSEERYRAVVEDQTELICRFLPDCTLTFVNGSYSRYFGSTPEQLIGQNFLDLIPESDRSLVQQQIDELSAAVPENAVIVHEHQVLKPNGDLGWQQWTNRAIFDDDGQLREIQAIGRDISEQQAAIGDYQQVEQSLRQSEDFNWQILETLPNCVKVLDLEGNIQYINPAGKRLLDLNDESCHNAN
ncbi:MAG: PAS domain S-box protein, partial [Waterburya sp.]